MSAERPSTPAAAVLPKKRTKTFQPFKTSSSRSTGKSDWLALSILTAKTAAAAGEFAPFPFIKGVFGTAVTLLEAVEKVQRNREHLKGLCEKIKEIIDVVRNEVVSHGYTAAIKVKSVCEDFEKFLQDMLVVIVKIQNMSHGVRGFIKSSSISADISGYEKRIQDLFELINFKLAADSNFNLSAMRPKVDEIHAILSRVDFNRMNVSENVNNCPSPSRIFHGRDGILNKMHKYFSQDLGKQHVYVLYGLGGAGKTQIALKFIQESTRFSNTFFIDASNLKTIETGLKNIATLRNAGNSSDDAVQWLLAKHEEWLLFFDNADDPRLDLNKVLPSCNHGNIIITSRNPELRAYGGATHVGDMNEQDAVALLLRSAAVEEITVSNQKTAEEIVKALWYLPLAIVQAGAFISKSGTLKRYLQLYVENHDRLLRERPAQTHSDYAWTVYTTWQMSFDQLSPIAAMFLQLCSFLHREGISEDIFSRAAAYSFPIIGPAKEKLQKPLQFLSHFQQPNGRWDPLAFLDVTNEIKGYSLLDFNTEKEVFSIHPLVHEWSRTTIPNPELNFHIISSVLGMSIYQVPTTDQQLTGLKLLPHVDAVMQFKGSFPLQFMAQYGVQYSWAGRHGAAKALQIFALENERRFRGEDHLNTVYAMHVLAVTYMFLGDLHEAERLQAVVVEKRRGLLGPDHPETLSAMQNLAVTHSKLGQFQKAEDLEIVVLQKRREILGEDHPETLKTMNNLAGTYSTLGKSQKAEELGLAVVEKGRAILGEGHPDTLKAMYNVAIAYRTTGQFQKAEELELRVLEARRSIFGDGDPETLDVMQNLAVTYKNLGQFEKAETLELAVLERRKIVFGGDHPETLGAMYNLAITYGELAKYQEAEQLEVLVMEKRRTILGADHPDTLSAMNNLAVTYSRLNQFKQAQDLQTEAFNKQISVLGENHPSTLLSQKNLVVFRRSHAATEIPTT
ncbi:hypothetical protein B0H16DRAFT_1362830 [Mycena metata]|uniref:DUF7779 domain-containing protein n=1 Tax=Mycena metata TaxID=1033252 RepID=A0AAD7JXE1_9AGAR|nr:hypothetical protein B0H16DRAFT_1362830 [Mycena metata]